MADWSTPNDLLSCPNCGGQLQELCEPANEYHTVDSWFYRCACGWADSRPARYDSTSENRIKAALDLVLRFGGIDGAHHKQWLLDQIVRSLVKDYDGWVREFEAGEDGPQTYRWDKGIAP